jgi:hypothetical protein
MHALEAKRIATKAHTYLKGLFDAILFAATDGVFDITYPLPGDNDIISVTDIKAILESKGYIVRERYPSEIWIDWAQSKEEA